MNFAVVYIGEEKYSVGGPALYADQVVLDPSLARSGSAYQRAASGIDAVCQAVESLWARGATDVSRRCARRALELLLRHIEPFVEHATPDTARGMALGSHLAGRAIDISKTTAPHALSYVMSKRYGISHGHAVALTLGRFIALHAELQPHRLQRGVDPCTHRQAMSFILRAFNASDGLAADRAVEALMMRLGLEHRLEAIGLSGADAMERVARSVNLERLGNNPADLMQTDLFALLADPRVGAAIGIQIT